MKWGREKYPPLLPSKGFGSTLVEGLLSANSAVPSTMTGDRPVISEHHLAIVPSGTVAPSSSAEH